MKMSPSIFDKEHPFLKNSTIPAKDTFSRKPLPPQEPEQKNIQNPNLPLDKLSFSPTALSTLEREQAQKNSHSRDPAAIQDLSLDEGLKYHFLRNLFLAMSGENSSTAAYLLPPPSKESVEKLKMLIQKVQISLKKNHPFSNQIYNIQIQRTHAVLENGQVTYSGSGVIHSKDGQKIGFDIKLNLSLESAETYGIPIPAGKSVRKVLGTAH